MDLQYIYKKKSTAKIKLISLTGKPTDCNTITIVTRPALGILAAPIDATVAVKLLVVRRSRMIFMFKKFSITNVSKTL